MDSLSLSAWLPYVTLDWIIVGALAGLISIDALRSGSHRAASLALAFPIAAFLFPLLGVAWGIGGSAASLGATLQAVAFIVLAVVLYFAFGRFTDTYDNGGFLRALVVGVTVGGVVLASWLSVSALQALWQPNAIIMALFSENFRFWWILGGLLILSFVRR